MSATALRIRPRFPGSSYWLKGLSLGTNGDFDWFVGEKMGGNLQRYDREKTVFRIPICDNHSGVTSRREMTIFMTKFMTVFQNTTPGFLISMISRILLYCT